MQTIMYLIFAVVMATGISIGVACIIAAIHEKRDNTSRLEREILRNRIIESPNTMDALYREYKSIGGNGYLTLLYTPTEYKPKHISPHIHNCINCGAPLRKDQHKCEYCNTEYF